MKRFYLAGQTNFGNRGCEALVRSTTQLLQDAFGAVEVLVPSYRPDLDAKQWKSTGDASHRFVRAMPYPFELKVWGKLRQHYPAIDRLYYPDYRLPADIREDIAQCDAMLMIGGDNLTLDYGLESLIWHIRFAQHAQKLGKPVMIWGASIGPFDANPRIAHWVTHFLNTTTSITVRETITYDYLRQLAVQAPVHLVADGAFVMEPEAISIHTWGLPTNKPILGFNVSPLIFDLHKQTHGAQYLQDEIVAFIETVLASTDLSIALIPHVDPLDGSHNNSDSACLHSIFQRLNGRHNRVIQLPSTLNAAQLKSAIGQCNFFIGARTHATIAAFSSFVPTLSIAYSTKAKGLNRDLFGHENYVVDTPVVNRDALLDGLQRLQTDASDIQKTLARRIPEWKKETAISARELGYALHPSIPC